jgi:hypothetical protein
MRLRATFLASLPAISAFLVVWITLARGSFNLFSSMSEACASEINIPYLTSTARFDIERAALGI